MNEGRARGLWCGFACVVTVLFGTIPARADSIPAWPVRINVSMPFGHTFGREHLHGFTWGFRGAVMGYPTQGGRGVGFGGVADALIDSSTRSMYSLSGALTAPVVSWEAVDLRLGAAVGSRWSGEPGRERLLTTALLTEFVFPAYLYDFRLGLRLDGSYDSAGMSARSVLVEIDVAVVLAALGWAASAR